MTLVITCVTELARCSTCSSAGRPFMCCSLAEQLALVLSKLLRKARACVWTGKRACKEIPSFCIMPCEGSERAFINFW